MAWARYVWAGEKAEEADGVQQRRDCVIEGAACGAKRRLFGAAVDMRRVRLWVN